MGTNYYAEDQHIGKRSAAGWYCWDCGVTLCKGGNDKVHLESEWYDKCPICGQSITEEDLDHSSAGRELGFNKDRPMKKTGVKSCSSFTWDIPPDSWEEAVKRSKEKVVEDEHGRKFTAKQFKEILAECPIQYEDSIGQSFS